MPLAGRKDKKTRKREKSFGSTPEPSCGDNPAHDVGLWLVCLCCALCRGQQRTGHINTRLTRTCCEKQYLGERIDCILFARVSLESVLSKPKQHCLLGTTSIATFEEPSLLSSLVPSHNPPPSTHLKSLLPSQWTALQLQTRHSRQPTARPQRPLPLRPPTWASVPAMGVVSSKSSLRAQRTSSLAMRIPSTRRIILTPMAGTLA